MWNLGKCRDEDGGANTVISSATEYILHSSVPDDTHWILRFTSISGAYLYYFCGDPFAFLDRLGI